MPEVEMIYHMKGATKKGKQRIKQHGTRWNVVESVKALLVVFSFGQMKPMIYVG